MPKDRVIVDVDARGRVSLARFEVKSTQLIVDPLPDGGLVTYMPDYGDMIRAKGR